jgi:hypothetical protein
VAPWGRSERGFVLGQFARTEQVLMGDVNAGRAFQQGGVARLPMYWRVNVIEIMRMTALAIRRRNELLGPLAAHDPLLREISTTLVRGNLAPANHWSSAWIDLLRGLAQEGLGKLDEADMLLGRSLVVAGQFDHPLTCVALLEQGRIAMIRGDTGKAGQLLAEAGYSAFYFENWDVLTESALVGWINYTTSGGVGVYPPLAPIAAWAQANRLQHVATKLRLAQAESLFFAGQIDAGAAILEDSGRRMGEMRGGLPGIHHLFLQAVLQFMRGQVEAGGGLLAQALRAQAGVSPRDFQIVRLNEMYDSGAVSPRTAVTLYEDVLVDPTPADWALSPLDVMAVLATNNAAAFDRWFVAALERKDAALAFSIAEQAKRRRFLASRPFGGRLLALSTILEAPMEDLPQAAVLQRQQLHSNFPGYLALAQAGQKLESQLRTGPVIAADQKDSKTLGAQYKAWEKNVEQRQQLVAQMAVRRVPSELVFPPRRSAQEIQAALGEGEALVVFHTAADNLHGFLVTRTDAHLWQLPDVRQLRAGVSQFLQALGNFGSNRQISLAELVGNKWRSAAAENYAAVFSNARFDAAKTAGLMIVPDDVLWYLPFEALVAGKGANEPLLADRMPIRYGPTAALAVANPLPLRRVQHTGIVGNEFKLTSDDEERKAVVESLASVVSGPVLLPSVLPEPDYLVGPLLDELVVLDDAGLSGDAASWSPLPRSRGSSDSPDSWFELPYGGPEQIVLAGFTTDAEQGLKGSRRTAKRGAPGEEVFQTLCGLMGSGARTILLARWRTGGRTNLDLVREYAQELPNIPADEAWQRACWLAREAQLDASREPRLKRSDEATKMPTAEHPFFWAGYMLVDTGPRPIPEGQPPAAGAPITTDAAKGGLAKDSVTKDGAPMPNPPGSKPTESSAPAGEVPKGKELPPPEQPPSIANDKAVEEAAE